MIGAELTKLDDFTLSLLTNDEVLALTKNQAQAKLVSRTEDYAVWATRAVPTVGATSLSDVCGSADFYVALFNLSDEPRDVRVNLEEVSQTLFGTSDAPVCARSTKAAASDANSALANASSAAPICDATTPEQATVSDANCAGTPATLTVRDLWQHKNISTIAKNGTLSANLAPHASLLVRLSTNN